MEPVIPPPEIIAKQEALKGFIDDGLAQINKIQGNIQQWKDDLKAIERVITAVYKPANEAHIVQHVPEEKTAIARREPKRIIPFQEYKDIILPFMKNSDVVKSADLKKYVSSMVGFQISDDMISMAMKKIIAESGSPIIKLKQGVFIDTSNLPDLPF